MSKNKTLYQEVYRQQNLFAAWRHVKKSAHNSTRAEIRGEASEFEHRHQSHLARIARQLREKRYKFSPVHGVLKDKKERLAKGKDPRPVAIAKMDDRVVQRAILQTLQPRKVVDATNPNSKAELLTDIRLGLINQINRSKFGVGGLLKPYGGVQPGIQLILQAMEDGAQFFFQSDIKAFFTDIPVHEVVNILARETQDELFCQLFEDALAIELENEEELETYSALFPSGGIGVAQGGSLSAFAGNTLLYELDHRLNEMDVTAVRYIDDILMVSKTKDDLDRAVNFAKSQLQNFGFSLYPPNKLLGKADEGLCSGSFNFLGCTLQPRRCVPSKQSIDRKTKEFKELISSSKSSIKSFVVDGRPLNPRHSYSSVNKRVGDQLYGWQKSFSFCTDAHEFKVIDKSVSKMIHDYNHAVQRMISKSEAKVVARVMGVPSAAEEYLKDKSKKK